MNEFVDRNKTKGEETGVRPNPRFDRDRKETDNALEEDLPILTIYMIEGPHDP